MASGSVPMDWEPEMPGQFNTPKRISRKRAAEEAGFTADDLEGYIHPGRIPQEVCADQSH